MEKQLPQQNNVQTSLQFPLQGAWTGDLKPVKLNGLYKGGKLCDMPMYNKASCMDPTPTLNKCKTVTQSFTRDSYLS